MCQVLELQSLMDNLSEDVRADFLSGTNGAVVSWVNLVTNKPWLSGLIWIIKSPVSQRYEYQYISPVEASWFYSWTSIIQNHYPKMYAQEHKLYCYYYHFGGHWENKIWKKWNSLKNISLTNAVRKWQQTLWWLLDFDCLLTLYDYFILIFHWFISAG